MITLIQKDLRQTFWPALLAVLLLIAPALAWGSSVLADSHRLAFQNIWRELASCAGIGAVASLLASSSASGVAFAKERRERTADLMATLPLPRWRAVVSKGAAALLVALVPCALGLAASLYFSIGAGASPWGRDSSLGDGFRAIIAGWLLLFGLGWGLSSVLRSEVLAAAAPVLVLVVLAASVATWWQPAYGEMPVMLAERLVYARMTWAFGVVGAAGLIAGTVIALRRKSP